MAVTRGVNREFPFTGESLSVKVLDNKRVNSTGKLKDTFRKRYGKVFRHRIFWTYIPEKEGDAPEKTVCQVLENRPKDNYEKYEFTTVNSSGGFKLHPNSDVKPGDYVAFVGNGDSFYVVKSEERQKNENGNMIRC